MSPARADRVTDRKSVMNRQIRGQTEEEEVIFIYPPAFIGDTKEMVSVR